MNQQSFLCLSPISPILKKRRQVKDKAKSILIYFLDTDGIIHKDFISSSHTVSTKFYYDVLRQLMENVRQKLSGYWRANSLGVRQFLAFKTMVVT